MGVISPCILDASLQLVHGSDQGRWNDNTHAELSNTETSDGYQASQIFAQFLDSVFRELPRLGLQRHTRRVFLGQRSNSLGSSDSCHETVLHGDEYINAVASTVRRSL